MAQRRMLFAAAWLAGMFLPTVAMSADFRSVGERPTILFDAPAAKSTKLHVLGAWQPVEVVVKLDKWSKVRDFSGELAWVENVALTDKRLVVVSAAAAEVRSQSKAAAPIAFEVKRGVVLELTGAPVEGFAPVRHRDGAAGFIPISLIWGL